MKGGRPSHTQNGPVGPTSIRERVIMDNYATIV